MLETWWSWLQIMFKIHVAPVFTLCFALLTVYFLLSCSILQIVSERHLMKYVSECLSGGNVGVKIAACKCLHSLSRSTKLLRTTIIDTEVWKHILEVCSCSFLVLFSCILEL